MTVKKVLLFIVAVGICMLFFCAGTWYEHSKHVAASMTAFFNAKASLAGKNYQDAVVNITDDEPSDTAWTRAEVLGDAFACLGQKDSAVVWYKVAQRLLVGSGQKPNALLERKSTNPNCPS